MQVGPDVREPIGLRGRSMECARLDDVADAVRRGESCTLLLHGEPGIGKTALLDYLVESAQDMRVLRAGGVESEMELAFASLHQLCAPLLDGVERLPAPQRDALAIAFGLRAGPPPDRFLVGLAVLTLLATAAEERPLLCTVDDAQWLDDVSAKTLAFVARRLLAEPVGLLFAARAPTLDLRGLPRLEVVGLANGAARALLRSAVLSPLDERIQNRIVAETRGNPLALLELPRALSRTALAGGLGLVEFTSSALSARLEESFERRVEALEAPARLLLLVVAAEPVGDPAVVWRAARRLGIDAAAVDTGGLLTIAEPMRFRHPLVRSAVYRSAPPEQRRRAHLALAEVTDRHADPDRRAWHLAAAATGPDEAVAQDLERSAGRATARGGMAAAAAFLQRALELTADEERRAERALAAAEACLQAGAFDSAQQHVAAAEAHALDDFQRARIDLLRGHVGFALGFGSEVPSLLLRAARRLEPFDPDLARQTYLTAWGAASVAAGSHGDGGGALLEISRAILELPRSPGSERPLELLLEGLALLPTAGRGVATATLKQAAAALPDIPVEEVLRWGWMATAPSNAVWDNDGAYAISARQVRLLRDAGALARLPLHLSALGLASAWIGDLTGAVSHMAEAGSVAAATGGVSFPWIELRLLALQGKEVEAAAAIASAIEKEAAGEHGQAIWAHWAAAVLYNGLGRYEQALTSARTAVSGSFDYFVSPWMLPELVEAAARVGDAAGAGDALERLAETTQPSANDLALGVEARCRALLSDGAAADDRYREAIDRLTRTSLRPELARAHLLYGEWLRREGRRADAREHLNAAHEMFTAIGMEAFAERTRRELVATGVTIRSRAPALRDALTPQEEQIARLARDRNSNAEIASQLFLSTRTVEWHLRKVYAKLGIRSRRDLVRVLADGSSVSVARHPAS